MYVAHFWGGSNFLHSIKDYHFLSKSRACFPRPVSLPLSRFLSVYLAVIHFSMYSSTHTHHTRQRGSLLLCAQQTRTITFFGWDIIIIIITIITRRCVVGESCKRARTHIYTSEAHTQARELAKQPTPQQQQQQHKHPSSISSMPICSLCVVLVSIILSSPLDAIAAQPQPATPFGRERICTHKLMQKFRRLSNDRKEWIFPLCRDYYCPVPLLTNHL